MLGCIPLPQCERRLRGSLIKDVGILGENEGKRRRTSQPGLAVERCVSSDLVVQRNSPIMRSYHLCKPQSRDGSPRDHPRQVDFSCHSTGLSTLSLHEHGLLKRGHDDTEVCPSYLLLGPLIRIAWSISVAPSVVVSSVVLYSVYH